MLHKDLGRITSDVLKNYDKEEFIYSRVEEHDINALIEFRNRQREDYLKYFDPHRFDRTTLERMLRNKAYVLMKVTQRDSKEIVGYFFLRCFFIGKAFHGLIVDEAFTNRGIGTRLWKIANEVCTDFGIRMYATVSKHNIPSLTSARNATNVDVKKNLKNDFLLIECKRK